MEISSLTLGRENIRIFQDKLLLPWVRNVRKKKEKKSKKNQSKIEEKQKKIEKKEKKREGFFGLGNV